MFESKTKQELLEKVKDLIRINNKNVIEHQRIEIDSIAKKQKLTISSLKEERRKLLAQVDDVKMKWKVTRN